MDIEKWTDKALAKLENRISREYELAGAELGEKADAHFSKYSARMAEEYQAMLARKGGYATAKTEREALEKYKAWQYSYIGRGEDWNNLKAQMVERMNTASQISAGYINGTLPSVYVRNSNAVADLAKASAMEQGVTGIRFDLVDEYTVKNLMKKSSEVKPYKPIAINTKKLTNYNANKMQNALLQSILQGESVGQLADRFVKLGFNSRSWAIANARTAITGARNAGKQDRYDDLAEQGVVFTKIWNATNDDRTREEHAEADGQEVPYDEPFDVGGEELMYPADPSGSDWNIINCRCSMKTGKPSFKSILSDKTRQSANIRVIE